MMQQENELFPVSVSLVPVLFFWFRMNQYIRTWVRLACHIVDYLSGSIETVKMRFHRSSLVLIR